MLDIPIKASIQYVSPITVTSICINLHFTRTSKNENKNHYFPHCHCIDDDEIED